MRGAAGVDRRLSPMRLMSARPSLKRAEGSSETSVVMSRPRGERYSSCRPRRCNMAYDAMLEGKTGLMSALVKACYELVPIPDPKLGPRKLDVATMYNTERYRPMYANKRGLPVFLQRVS